MIVLTTPTGGIGRQVLDRVLNSGEAFRVIARDPSRLPEEVRTRAEVVPGSHGDAETISKALVGADRLFWLVPPPGFAAPIGAVKHYLDFTGPLSRALEDRGIGVVGVTSLGHGYQGRSGLLEAAFAMDALIEGTGTPYRALALPFFMENLLRQVESIKEQGSFSMANAADRPLLTVATRDAATAAAGLLLDSSWSDQARVPVVSPDNLTPNEMAAVISDVLGRPISYHQVPIEGLRAQMQQHGAGPALAEGMPEMIEAQNDGIYDAEPLAPRGSKVAGETSFRQWCVDTLEPAVRG